MSESNTTHDQGDERRAFDREVGCKIDDAATRGIAWMAWQAARALSAAQPVGYALISIDALRAWGKLDEVRDACKYPLAAPQPSQGATCGTCGGSKKVEQFTSAGAPTHKIPCPSCTAAPHRPVSAAPSALPAQAVGEKIELKEPTTQTQWNRVYELIRYWAGRARTAEAELASTDRSALQVTDAMRKAFDDRNNTLEADERDDIIAAILALAAPMPQPEPTSKGEEPHLPSDGDYLRWAQKEGAKVNWDFEGPNESRVSFANGAQWGRFCDAVRAAYPPSQQREPQEAAERPANFTELWELYSRVGDAHENHGRNHEKTMEARATFHAALMRALSAPQEASKPEIASGETVDYKPSLQCTCGAEWECGQFGWEMVAAPHTKEASKVEPVAGDDALFQLLCNFCQASQDTDRGDARWDKAVEAIRRHFASPLYLRPTQQALSDAQRRVLDFLYGVGELEGCGFSEKPAGELGNFWWRKHLRSAFPDILAAAGGGEK